MRTTDFSHSPEYAQTEAMFYGATRYTLKGLLELPLKWTKLWLRLRKDPGFVRLKLWFEFPRTVGSIVFFRSKGDLMRFARKEEHRDIMIWIADETRADAGFIRIFEVMPQGYANGAWSESGKMTHIKHFSRAPSEEEGPLVDEENPDSQNALD